VSASPTSIRRAVTSKLIRSRISSTRGGIGRVSIYIYEHPSRGLVRGRRPQVGALNRNKKCPTSYSPPPSSNVENGVEIPDYLFMHVLRGDVNGTWGDLLKEAPVANGYQFSKTYNSNVNPWNGLRKNLKNCAVVAILYTKDKASGAIMEVLQVEKLYLMK